jgi:hypothetical protein
MFWGFLRFPARPSESLKELNLLQDDNTEYKALRVRRFARSSFWSINSTELITCITEFKKNVMLWGFPRLPARPYEALDSSADPASQRSTVRLPHKDLLFSAF